MTDTTLIWKAMNIMILDSHPAVYQYVKGQSKSREGAVMRVSEILYRPFIGVFTNFGATPMYNFNNCLVVNIFGCSISPMLPTAFV